MKSNTVVVPRPRDGCDTTGMSGEGGHRGKAVTVAKFSR